MDNAKPTPTLKKKVRSRADERLRRHVRYDQNTGSFTWIIPTNGRVKSGSVAGSTRKDGYVQFSFDGRKQLAHRLAWLYVYGAWPSDQIDHINGDKADNRIANLREATQGQNMQNRHRPRKDSRSGVLGVHWSSTLRKWRAEIQIDGETKRLGEFESREEAGEAYKNAKSIFHPFANRHQSNCEPEAGN